MPPLPASARTPSVRSARSWLVATAESLVCGLLGALILLVGFGALLEEFADDPPAGLVLLTGIDALVGLVASAAVGPLRLVLPGRWRTGLHLVLAAACGASSWAIPASLIALYRLGRRRRLAVDVVALLLVSSMSIAFLSADLAIRQTSADRWTGITILVMLLVTAIPLLIGRVLGTREALLASLREQAAAAERERETADRERRAADAARVAAEREAEVLVREREAEAGRVRAEERAGLARDMHDSVSHHLAAIAMHAGAIAYREDLPAEAVRSASRTIRDSAQQANAELRDVLGALRDTAGTAPLATGPTLQAIVDRARSDGTDVTLEWDGVDAEELGRRRRSAVVALARILAESLVNAAKHAPGAPVRARLHRRHTTLLLTVRSGPTPGGEAPSEAAPSTGNGLIGVQERARLLGGDARWGRVEENPDMFEVEAEIPW